MKYALLLGGLIGFGSIFVVSLLVGKEPSVAIVEASIGCVVVGLLFRWVGVIWIRNVKQMLMEKHQAAVAAVAEAEERQRKETKESVS